MSDSLALPYPIEMTNPVAAVKTFGPWPSVAAACENVPQAVRHDGLLVMITGQGLYWWLADDLSDAGLRPMLAIGSGGPSEANVPEYDPAVSYPLHYVVRATVGGYEGLYAAEQAGVLPAPSDPRIDAYWRRVALPMPPTMLYQVMPWAAAVNYDGDDQLARGREYLIIDRPGGGAPVRGTFSRFAPAAMEFAVLDGFSGPVAYDLGNDAATPAGAVHTTDDLPAGARADRQYYSNELAVLGLAFGGFATVTTNGLVSVHHSADQAFDSAIAGSVVRLYGHHGDVRVTKSGIRLIADSIRDLTLGYGVYGAFETDVEAVVTNRFVVGSSFSGDTHEIRARITPTPTTWFESFTYYAPNGTRTNVDLTIDYARNTEAYVAPGNGQKAAGLFKFQERNYEGYSVWRIRGNFGSLYNPVFSGYPDSRSRVNLENGCELHPGAGKPMTELYFLNGGAVDPAVFLVDNRTVGGGSGGIAYASLSVSGQNLTLSTSSGDSTVALPGSSTSTNYTQIRSVNGKRVVEIPVLSPVTVLEEIFDQNVQGVEYQLDLQTRTGTRQYGTAGISRADVLPLLAALTPADFAAGVKLYARTVVVSPPDPANLILKFEYA